MVFKRISLIAILAINVVYNNAAVAPFLAEDDVSNMPHSQRSMQDDASSLCLDGHNAERAKLGKPALSWSPELANAASNHNQVMTSQNCFSHQCDGEPSLGQRVTDAGFEWGGVGENIAANNQDCKSALASWMNSAGHKKNILGDWSSVGCVVNDCSGCNYNKYWTCVFARGF